MYTFNKTEEEFLKRFGGTSNGKEVLALLERIKVKADSASAIPKGADYGAQVEGRRLVTSLLTDITDLMNKKEKYTEKPEVGVDEYN